MKKIIQILIIASLFSCTTTKVVTTNLHDLASFEQSARIYSLPRTRLLVNVKAVKHTFYPGPYHQFAKKYLGIEGAKAFPSTFWEITDLRLYTLSEPDPERYYSVRSTNPDELQNKFMSLSENGLILSPADFKSFQVFNSNELETVEENSYTDLSIRSFMPDDQKKRPKNAIYDSNYIRIPSWEKQVIGKSLEEKAFEASKFIFKIRKRRFKLLSGQYDVFPEEQALAISVRELNALENEYLSLFIGKEKTDTINSQYTFTPGSGPELQRNTLFRFSDDTGFNTSAENEGIPVILEIQDLQTNKILNQLQIPYSTSYSNVIFYRMPDRALVKILYGSHVLLESEVSVEQFGVVVPMSTKESVLPILK
ncbi:MAG: DUF4831 family protein [Bacteroidales bacterium]|nr:DUF4831 family protein [Bacteroidales bacterium]MBN2821143.1 DUF4831 family protein [Bacteroidales bacterium]